MISLLADPSLTHSSVSPLAADLYLRVREREGRLYTDDIASHLPDFPSDHPLKSEWLARASSARRLLKYLRRLPRSLDVLDVGCGNGWLSHLVAGVEGTRVWGLDRPGP